MTSGSGNIAVSLLEADAASVVVEVLADAFRDYPVMRFVLGQHTGEYEARLRTLIHFFVMARVTRGEAMLGIGAVEDLEAAAIVSRPGSPTPDALRPIRESTWAELGEDARARYRAFGAATAPFDLDEPHIHLNMIGVRGSAQGRGLARYLLEHVHALSAADPTSVGVTLSTENPSNVPLYEHFGYRVIGRARVAPGLETWCFFRPDPGGGS